MNNSSKLKRLFGGKSLDARKARAGYVFVLPFILGVLLIYLPILIDSIWWSFHTFEIELVNGVSTEVYLPNYFINCCWIQF